MARYTSLVPGVEIENVAEDFKNALKVEQYRLGKDALYFPAGFRWEYIPFSSIVNVNGSYRNVTAGHCVTVTETKPAVDIVTLTGSFTLNLEKADSVRRVLEVIGK